LPNWAPDPNHDNSFPPKPATAAFGDATAAAGDGRNTGGAAMAAEAPDPTIDDPTTDDATTDPAGGVAGADSSVKLRGVLFTAPGIVVALTDDDAGDLPEDEAWSRSVSVGAGGSDESAVRCRWARSPGPPVFLGRVRADIADSAVPAGSPGVAAAAGAPTPRDPACGGAGRPVGAEESAEAVAPAEPVVSAYATGREPMPAPMPRATANAPTRPTELA